MVFGKIKKTLGIEGVKLTLLVPEKVSKDAGLLTGIVKLTSLSDNNTIKSIEIQVIEKYTRGKGENKLIDEYAMGKVVLNKPIPIHKDDILEIPFELDFTFVPSEMDKMEQKNIFSKGIVTLAKKLKGVKSEYSVRAHAVVNGTALHPHDVKAIILT